MKKIFTLAIALIAIVGVANAQTYYMQINKTDGTTDEYAIDEVASITHELEVVDTDEWAEYGVGTFSYNIFWSGTKTDLKVYRNIQDPTVFKVAHWAYGSDANLDFNFSYYESTGTLVANQSETGHVHEDHGMLYANDVSHYSGVYTTYESYKSGDVFYFSLVYYYDDNWFGNTGDSWGDTYETLTMTSYN